jgi:hypothetical protein
MRGEPAPRGGERREPNPLFLTHAAALTEFYVAVYTTARAAGFRGLRYGREGDARETFKDGARERALAPDATLALIDEQDRGFRAFVEIDLGTMSHARLHAKAELYAAYAASDAWRARHTYTVEHRDALEERLDRTRDLYELGDLTRPEYIARRDAINTELATQALPSLDQASKVLEDFTTFWAGETDPAAKRQFLSHAFGGVWLDHDRIVAVQPKPSFLPFFADQRPRTAEEARVNDGNDGGRARVCHPAD